MQCHNVHWIDCVAFGYRKPLLYNITSSWLSFAMHACKHFDMLRISQQGFGYA